jgi:hypothetical protein
LHPTLAVTSSADRYGILAATGVLVEKGERADLGELSVNADSGLTSSPLSEDITNDIESLGTNRMVVLFAVGISARTSSTAEGLRSPDFEIGRLPSCVPIFLFLGPGHWNVPMTQG